MNLLYCLLVLFQILNDNQKIYRYMKVAILGSRDQLCVNPAVMQAPSSKEKLNMCQEQASG